MSDFYKILKADPLGDPWTPKQPGASPIQTWWCQVDGQELDVSIGKQVGNTLTPGQHVYGDLMYAKSQKGTEYWRFKSQKIPDDVAKPQDDPATPAQATAQQATSEAVGADIPKWFMPFGNLLIDLQKKMQLLTGEVDNIPTPPVAEPTPEKPKAVEQVSGTPLDEKDKEVLEGIFGEIKIPDVKPKKLASKAKLENDLLDAVEGQE